MRPCLLRCDPRSSARRQAPSPLGQRALPPQLAAPLQALAVQWERLRRLREPAPLRPPQQRPLRQAPAPRGHQAPPSQLTAPLPAPALRCCSATPAAAPAAAGTGAVGAAGASATVCGANAGASSAMGAFAPPPRAGSAATSALSPQQRPLRRAPAPLGHQAPPPQLVEPAAAGSERPHCCQGPAPPPRPLRVRPYRRRRPPPVAAKMEVENQHNHPPLFLLSLFSSGRNLACRSEAHGHLYHQISLAIKHVKLLTELSGSPSRASACLQLCRASRGQGLVPAWRRCASRARSAPACRRPLCRLLPSIFAPAHTIFAPSIFAPQHQLKGQILQYFC